VRLWPDDSVTFSGEAIRLLILFVAQQKLSRGGLWHPILMQFYSGPLMHLLSGVDRRQCILAAQGTAVLGGGISTPATRGPAFEGPVTAWLTDVLRRINDHPAARLDELLPWNWKDWPAKLAA
jgi:hypothetical protein